MNVVVLDTDVVSSLLQRRPAVQLTRLLAARTPALTFVNVGELSAWVRERRWGPRRLAEARTAVGPYAVLPYDEEVAERWGDMTVHARARGRIRPANDTWIAACCIVRGLALATLNTKDFAYFAEHEGLELVALS